MEEKRAYELHSGPMQGYTDAIWRNAYEKYFGGIDAYYTPFIRVEKGVTFRRKDLRDLEPCRNRVPRLIPQILPGSPDEFRLLAELIRRNGYTSADINLGCPFPMIAGKRKGAGMLPYPERVREVLETLQEFPGIRFSLKMRLGWENAGECLSLVDVLNDLRLCHITVHARTGKQGYRGEADLEAFAAFYARCKHPLFYNGDLKSPEDIERIFEKFPLLRGVSLCRGLLSSPWMAKEFRTNETFLPEKRMSLFAAFHEELFSGYAELLQGENQLLNHIKTLWEYGVGETDRKMLKKIKKASRIDDYLEAVRMITKG